MRTKKMLLKIKYDHIAVATRNETVMESNAPDLFYVQWVLSKL